MTPADAVRDLVLSFLTPGGGFLHPRDIEARVGAFVRAALAAARADQRRADAALVRREAPAAARRAWETCRERAGVWDPVVIITNEMDAIAAAVEAMGD